MAEAAAIQAIGAINGLEQTSATAGVIPVEPENSTPFQAMLDTAIGALENVSATEEKANAYIAQYAKGNVSMEEVLMEVNKMTMAVELATSLINQVVTTFKEIQQMPV